MRSGNLFNLIRDRVTESQFNVIYTMVTGMEVYSRAGDDFPEDHPSVPVTNAIQCNWTACRLKNDSDPVPDDIERCQ